MKGKLQSMQTFEDMKLAEIPIKAKKQKMFGAIKGLFTESPEKILGSGTPVVNTIKYWDYNIIDLLRKGFWGFGAEIN